MVYGVKVPIITYYSEVDGLLGYCTKRPIKIYINTSSSKKDQMDSLCHEIVHAVTFRLGLDQVLSPEIQEVIAESFGNFIADNFKFK